VVQGSSEFTEASEMILILKDFRTNMSEIGKTQVAIMKCMETIAATLKINHGASLSAISKLELFFGEIQKQNQVLIQTHTGTKQSIHEFSTLIRTTRDKVCIKNDAETWSVGSNEMEHIHSLMPTENTNISTIGRTICYALMICLCVGAFSALCFSSNHAINGSEFCRRVRPNYELASHLLSDNVSRIANSVIEYYKESIVMTPTI
jgi:hypothetical protein